MNFNAAAAVKKAKQYGVARVPGVPKIRGVKPGTKPAKKIGVADLMKGCA